MRKRKHSHRRRSTNKYRVSDGVKELLNFKGNMESQLSQGHKPTRIKTLNPEPVGEVAVASVWGTELRPS
jgi:hypothetical protein